MSRNAAFELSKFTWGKGKQKYRYPLHNKEVLRQMKKTKKLVMSWLLAFCCVITLVAPSVVNAAADDFEIIDDTVVRLKVWNPVVQVLVS